MNANEVAENWILENSNNSDFGTKLLKETTENTNVLHGFKRFDRNLRGLGKQYEVGKTFEEDEAILNKTGLHFYEQALDCFRLYEPSTSQFCAVTAIDPSPQTDPADSSRVTTKLLIEKKLTIAELIGCAANQMDKKQLTPPKKYENGNLPAVGNMGYKESIRSCGGGGIAKNTSYKGSAIAHGDFSFAVGSGEKGVVFNSGYGGLAGNSGHSGFAATTDFRAVAINNGTKGLAANDGCEGLAINTGHAGFAENVGENGAAVDSGCNSLAVNRGDSGTAVSLGDFGTAVTQAKNSVAVAVGRGSAVAGTLGSWLVLSERDSCDNIIDIKAIKVDGLTIKENTFYSLKNGEFVATASQYFMKPVRAY